MKPRVSVGVPVRNGAAYLAVALESVLTQSLGDLEVVIGDNASTDGTEALCRELAAADPRVRYFRHEANIGAGPNHNFVFERSRAEYFRWATHDDVCAPTLLARCVEVLDGRPEVVLVHPRTRRIDESGAPIGDYGATVAVSAPAPSRRLAALLLARPSALHYCYPIYGMMRSSTLAATPVIGPYNSSDAVLLAEMALRGPWHEIPEHLFSSRQHAASSLRANATPAEVAAWFRPDMGHRFPAPRSRLLAGYGRAIRRVPMPGRERLACARVLARWLGLDRNWRVIGGEAKIVLGERLGIREVDPGAGPGPVLRPR